MLLFFFNDAATTECYTLSLHAALPFCAERDRLEKRVARLRLRATRLRRRQRRLRERQERMRRRPAYLARHPLRATSKLRSEEHTSELQSRQYIVCCLLLEKKTNPRHGF